MSWAETKKINSDLNTPLNEGGVKIIKSIQRGTVTKSSNTYYVDVTVNEMNLQKTVIRTIRNEYIQSDNCRLTTYTADATIINSTTIRLMSSTNTSERSIDWEVIEFY